VNFPDASRFCREAHADWPWFFPTLPIFEKSRWRWKRRLRNPNWNGRIRGELGWNLWARMVREEPRRSHLSLRGPKYVSVSRRRKSIDGPTCQ
jgi:hypothetical protein